MSAVDTADVAGRPGLLHRYLPILGWLPHYNRKWIARDAVAGLSVWSLLVPQSLAYASIAGVPVQYGLYTAFVALIAYPIFGTSRQLAQGPSAAVCAVSAAVITPIVGASALGTGKAVGYSAALALATGAVYCNRLPARAALPRVSPASIGGAHDAGAGDHDRGGDVDRQRRRL